MGQDEAQLARLEKLAAGFAGADPRCLLLLEEALDSLLARAKTPGGREALGVCGAVQRLLTLVPMLGRHSPQLKILWAMEAEKQTEGSLEDGSDSVVGTFVLRPLLLLLRVLRNLCAGDKANQDSFLHGGIERMLQLSLALIDRGQLAPSERDKLEVVRTAVQTLGNVVGGGESHQAAMWALGFPDTFCQLSLCPLEEIQGPLSMVLFQCCKKSEVRRVHLSQAFPLLHSLFTAVFGNTPPLPQLSEAGLSEKEKPRVGCVDSLTEPGCDVADGPANEGVTGSAAHEAVGPLPSTCTGDSSWIPSGSMFTKSAAQPADEAPTSSSSMQELDSAANASRPSEPQIHSPVQPSSPHDSPSPSQGKAEPDPQTPVYSGGEWLEILMDLMALQQPLLPNMFEAISKGSQTRAPSGRAVIKAVQKMTLEEGTRRGDKSHVVQAFTAEHAVLLSVVSEALRLRLDAEDGATFPFPPSSAVFLLRVVASSAKQTALDGPHIHDLSTNPKVPPALYSVGASGTKAEAERGNGNSIANGVRNGNGNGNGTFSLGHDRSEVSQADVSVGQKSRVPNGGVSVRASLPPAVPTGRPTVDVLGLSLRLLSTICACQEIDGSDQGGLIPALLEGGLIPLLLSLLRALGPPVMLLGGSGESGGHVTGNGTTKGHVADTESGEAYGRVAESGETRGHVAGNESGDSVEAEASKEIAAGPSDWSQEQHVGERDTWSGVRTESTPSSSQTVPGQKHNLQQPGSSRLSGLYPDWTPYLGYRRDIVAVLANAAHRNPRVQDWVREGGGLLLILQQCVSEESSPFLREWALFAVRNLCEGNERNQGEISALEVRGAANTAETEKMGFRVEVDPKSGRPKLVNVEAKGVAAGG